MRRHIGQRADTMITSAATILSGKPSARGGAISPRKRLGALIFVLVLLLWFLVFSYFRAPATPNLQSKPASRGYHQSQDFVSSKIGSAAAQVQICGKAQLFYTQTGGGGLESWAVLGVGEFLDAAEADTDQECCNLCASGPKSKCTAYFYSGKICSLFKLVREALEPSGVGSSFERGDEVVTKAVKQPVEKPPAIVIENPFEDTPPEPPTQPIVIADLFDLEDTLVEDDDGESAGEELIVETNLPVEETSPDLSVEKTSPDLPVEETSPDLPVEETSPDLPVEEEEAIPDFTVDDDDEKEEEEATKPVETVPDLPMDEDDDDNNGDEEDDNAKKTLSDLPAEKEDNHKTNKSVEEEEVVPDLPKDNDDDDEDKEEPAAKTIDVEEDDEEEEASVISQTKPPTKEQRSSLDLDLESAFQDQFQDDGDGDDGGGGNGGKTQLLHSLDDLLNGEDLTELDGNVVEEDDGDNDNGDGDNDGGAETTAPKQQHTVQTSQQQLSDLSANNEVQLSPEQNAKLSQLPINNILIAGAYSVTLQDPFYTQKNSFKFFGRFRAVSEIHDFMLEFQASQQGSSKYPVDLVSIGLSAEGKAIKAMEIGNPNRGKHVFVIGGLRGCDWTGPLASVHSIISLMGRRRSTFALLDAVRIHFVPLVNVDGYHYSRRKSPATARHWCDNRRVSGGGHGANLERNFGLPDQTWGFGKQGKEGRKDKLGFQGLDGFSEPETQVVRDYIQHYITGTGRVAVVHVKCCAGTLAPPQPMPSQTANRDLQLIVVGSSTLGANLRANGNDYTVLHRTEPFGQDNTGQLIDWTYSLGVDHSYAVEIKAFSVATHNDRYQISPEPFMALAKELEIGIVTTTQLLLNQPIQGPAANGPYRPKVKLDKKPIGGVGSAKKKQ
ncbi:hypothetical protein BASA81_008890 [Batrachochytrium salamandrivorans]|nr:hypothetical protein BASA81_008890 [Batrachochytrium salamandrivorans]